MQPSVRRRPASQSFALDCALEALPLFRLSDSADDGGFTYEPERGGRWRVMAVPGERMPGTFDQDVYVEIFRRYHDAGAPADGTISFTLHDFLRSMGRRVDGRTYAQLRGALGRLERSALESAGAYYDAVTRAPVEGRFSVLTATRIVRRRRSDHEQLGLFAALPANEPGDASVTIAPVIRGNIRAGHVTQLVPAIYLALSSPVARRLYRLLAVVRASGQAEWSLPLGALASQLPLTQRYPSHLQRVVQPANEMLVASGVARRATLEQQGGAWVATYVLPPHPG